MRKLSCDPAIEIIGVAARAFTDNMNASDIKPMLAKYNFETVTDDAWYQMLNLLNLLNELHEMGNWSQNYVAMGMKRAEVAKMPPQAANMTFPQFLMNWNNVYQMQHRGGDSGHLEAKEMGERNYQVAFNIIYPDDFIYGVAYGMAKRFLPKGTRYMIQYDTTEPRMDEGGEVTRLNITWNA